MQPWLKLLSYGEYPHTKGLQVINKASASKLVSAFKTPLQRVQRFFSKIPIYIGHPDDPQFQGQHGHTDTQVYGHVANLEARADGLWILPKWTPKGEDLLYHGTYRFLSARWTLQSIGNGRYHPVRLLSIGLTNNPNIPSDALTFTAANTHLLKTHALSNTLHVSTSPKHFLNLVHSRMHATDTSFLAAWNATKNEQSTLFTQTFSS